LSNSEQEASEKQHEKSRTGRRSENVRTAGTSATPPHATPATPDKSKALPKALLLSTDLFFPLPVCGLFSGLVGISGLN
jgi:hypothetical protein